MANLNKEYERGFKDGLKSKIGDELLPMSEQILVGVSDAVKSVIPLMVDRMEIKANLDSNDWIPCGERLPESVANRVICFCKGDDAADWIGFGHCEIKDGHAIWLNLESELPFEAWRLTVTHWMPLPAPPKDDDEQEVTSDASNDSV